MEVVLVFLFAVFITSMRADRKAITRGHTLLTLSVVVAVALLSHRLA